ncbi:MAG TPA: serpin family protein, partial [Acidimicrobiia bacterium]|nr:serpin family protein [Acidimicrobiia bacterium]
NAIDLVLEGRAGDGLQLNTANRLFAQVGLPLEEEFLNVAVESYGAPALGVDFSRVEEVADLVNQWVAAETDGFVQELTQGYSPETVLVLANAMYLKARWAVPFRLLEEPGSFTTLSGEEVSTPVMAHDDFLPSFSGPDYTAVELPYVGGNLSLVVVQPTDFEAFEDELSLGRLEEIFDRLEEGGIHLTMPIWSTETSLELLNTLHTLGLPATYDFSAMIEGGEQGFFIDSVSHVARIEVDETGTTAGAATDVVIVVSHGPTVTIDRPYLYFVRDRGSGVILFMGQVVDPTA